MTEYSSPIVSIIIPCYNCAKFLGETLEDLLRQTLTTWECIIIDDGSTDNTKEIAQYYALKDPRFKYYGQPNAGPCAARNHGIRVSTGNFLQFLDSDDMLESRKLEKQIEIFSNNPACDIVYGSMKYFSRTDQGKIQTSENNGKYWKNGRTSGHGDEVLIELLRGNIMVINSPLIRRNVFEKAGLWDEQIPFNEDWDLWTRCALAGLSFEYDGSDGTCALVRIHEGSRSADRFQMYLNGLKVCMKLKPRLKQKRFQKILMPRIFTHQYFLDKILLDVYVQNRDVAIEKVSATCRQTGLIHYRILAWFFRNLPVFFSALFFNASHLLNRVKCKVLYES